MSGLAVAHLFLQGYCHATAVTRCFEGIRNRIPQPSPSVPTLLGHFTIDQVQLNFHWRLGGQWRRRRNKERFLTCTLKKKGRMEKNQGTALGASSASGQVSRVSLRHVFLTRKLLETFTNEAMPYL